MIRGNWRCPSRVLSTLCSLEVDCSVVILQLGPNADIKKWEEEQMGIATVRFGAKDAKEKNKVLQDIVHS